jgi:RNA polymerase sigma factor (sigma-70 family)
LEFSAPSCCRQGSSACCAQSGASIPRPERRSGPTAPGGCARGCSSSSRKWRGRSCYRIGHNAPWRRFARLGGSTSASTGESIVAAERAPHLLSEPLQAGDGTGGTLVELVADPVSEDEYERVIEQLDTEQVRGLTDALDDREREILYEHYGVGRPAQTFREIGARLGLSAERIRQIEEQALEKLRAAAS